MHSDKNGRMNSPIAKQIFTQLVATFGAMLLIIQTGIIDGWTSPNMARLTQTNSTIPMTLSEASWIATCLKLGRFVSVVLIPVFIDVLGSRKAILYTFIPIIVGWVLTMTAKVAILLYIGRFFSGMSYGLAYGAYSIFLGEVSTPRYRGTISSIAMVGWPLGIVIGTAAETNYDKITSCSVYLVLCLIGVLLFIWLPESPYHLIKKKKVEKASESLVWYRGHVDTKTEMDEIVEYIESTDKVTFSEKMEQLRFPKIRNAVILVTLVFCCPQFCGIYNIMFYMEIILTNAKSDMLEPSDIVIYTNVILLVSAIVSVNLSDKFGRRILLIVTCAIMTVCLFGLGLHFYLMNKVKVDPLSIQLLPIISIVVLLVAYSIGVGPVMGSLLGEMFPSGIKSTAAMIVTFASSLTGFISTLAYQHLIDGIGEICVFWIYAAFMALMIPSLMVLLTETRGKSLQQIQKVLSKT